MQDALNKSPDDSVSMGQKHEIREYFKIVPEPELEAQSLHLLIKSD